MKVEMKWKNRIRSNGIKGCLIGIIALFFIQTIAYAEPISKKILPSGSTVEQIGPQISQFVADHSSDTGVAVSVFYKNKTIVQDYYGYADRSTKSYVNKDSVMEWGSISKGLVWISVMQLWEQGRLQLNKDIRTYLPKGFLKNLHFKKKITMLHLMNHTGGFQDLIIDTFIRDPQNLQSLYKTLKSHQPEQVLLPGVATGYSDWGCALAAYIVQRISKINIVEYEHIHILNPLGMKHTAVASDLSDNPWVNKQRDRIKGYSSIQTELPRYYFTLFPAGSVTSTLRDLERFAKAILNHNRLLLKESTWKKMQSPSNYLGDSRIPVNYHGLWAQPYGQHVMGHQGNTMDFTATMILDVKNKIGCVVLVNESYDTTYTEQMPILLYGAFSSKAYFHVKREMPSGFFRMAKSIRYGPLKISSLFEIVAGVEDSELWMNGKIGHLDKICFPYGDFIEISMVTFILECILLLVWIFAFLFSFVSLAVRLTTIPIKLILRKPVRIQLGKWSSISAVVQMMSLGLLGLLVYRILQGSISTDYIWISKGFFVVLSMLLILIVIGIKKIVQTKSGHKRKIYNIIVLLSLIFAVINILYWNTFMFRRI